MKKLITLFACIILSAMTMAQGQHMKFKGIPIDGTLKEYINAMTKAGFTYDNTYDGIAGLKGIAVLKGDFAGFKNCTIGVSTLQNCDLVNCIAVLFPKNNKWADVLEDYEQLKAMLIQKYGEPESCKELFTKQVTDDDSKIDAASSDDYVWYANFETELGVIELSIVYSFWHRVAVKMVYYDKINTQKVKEAAIDDL